MTQLSARGAQFIGRFEGWRDKPYNDPANHATIGYGHLIHRGPVTAHDTAEWGTITVDHGVQLLQGDASVAEAAIGHYITRTLAQCEWDALTSFAYNCGGGALAKSVGQAVNAKQDPTAMLEQWNHAGHAVVEGLTKRRQAEARLFVTGDYGDELEPDPPGAPAKPKPAPAPSDVVPTPVPAWAWQWVEWKLGRAEFKGRAGDPALRAQTGAPATIPPWGWTFLKRFT
jgi:GH24 family phage-related lysozyme (muramidase)